VSAQIVSTFLHPPELPRLARQSVAGHPSWAYVAADDGKPVQATVSPVFAMWERQLAPRPPTKTDADGRFRLDSGVPGTMYGMSIIPVADKDLNIDSREVWLPADGRELDIGVVRLVKKISEDSPFDTSAGVGLSVHNRGGHAMVTSLMPDSPATKAGIKQGDLVLEIDGKPVGDLDGTAVKHMLSGDEGSRVVVRVQTGEEAPREVSFTRARY
jgi:membrane-associated protease RseP (regulator of RpoE activity)